MQIILDCTPGLDDVMAILLAARTLDLVGITVTHGNAPLGATHCIRLISLSPNHSNSLGYGLYQLAH
jgi:purine nucleosidase